MSKTATSDSTQPNNVTPISPETTPSAILKRLADHISANPFATDRKSVMVAAKGRELTTALQRAETLEAEAKSIREGQGQLVADAIAILAGTHPGLSAGNVAKAGK